MNDDREHLALLLETSRLLSQTLDLQSLLDRLMTQVVEVMGAERGFVILRQPDSDEWAFQAGHALDSDPMARDSISRGIADRVIREGVSVVTSDALQDKRFHQQASISLHQLRSILCVPILIASKVLGVIYLDHRRAEGAFDQRGRDLLEAIAGQAAMALENALLVDKFKRVYEESLAQARSELAATQSQLMQSSKLAAVGHLAAGVAHEINNPLGAVSLNLSGLRSQLSDPTQLKRIQLCETAIGRCKNIVGQLLNFAHPAAATPGPVDLVAVVTQVLDLLDADLRQAQITVQRELQPLPPISGQADELSQVFLNLILNARDALQQRAEGRRLWVRSRLGGEGQVQVEVVDNGPGVDPAVQEKIFNPFFTTKPIGQGVGLGLSVCHQIIQKHGGSLQLDNKPGQGCRFWVRLEAARG